MTKWQKSIIFLHYFGSGLFIPILSLFLIEHGCTLNNLAAIMGLYSLTVILTEIPSGLLADIKGRKACFYFSNAFTFCSFTIIYFSPTLFALSIGIIFFGMGKAFTSGSLDSLMLENCIARNGKSHLSHYVSMNLIFQCLGIACGCLLSGILPNVKGYLIHLVLRLFILITTCILCRYSIVETLQPTSPKHLLSNTKLVLKSNYTLYILLLGMLGTMFIIFSVETYWQPEFKSLLSTKQYYLLGVISACGYGATLLGSLLGGYIKMTCLGTKWVYYLLFNILATIILFTLTFQQNILGFMMIYILFLFSLGLISVPEQTLLNSMITNETRASVLSLSSLFSQLGGIIISCLSANLVLIIGIREIWVVSCFLTLSILFIITILLLLIHYKKSINNSN